MLRVSYAYVKSRPAWPICIDHTWAINPKHTMAKYQPIIMVDHYHGKICGHSDTYFAKKKGTLYTGRICNPRDLTKKPYKPAEIATHDKFRQARAAVLALTQEQIATYQTAFEKQLKSPKPKSAYLQGYIFAQEYAKLNP